MIFYNKIYKNLKRDSDAQTILSILNVFYAIIFLIWGAIALYSDLIPWCNTHSIVLAVIVGFIGGFYYLTCLSIIIAAFTQMDSGSDLEAKIYKLIYYITFGFVIADILYLAYKFCKLITYDWVMKVINYNENRTKKKIIKQQNSENQKYRIENLIDDLYDYTPEDTIY